ncbi:hypothetical protein C8R43DRAFT_887276, partial [Mycena crocata]
NFRFDVCGTQYSPWNKSAVRVFARLIIRKLHLPNTLEMFEAVRKAFSAHLGSIIKRYRLSLKTRAVQRRLRSLNRRRVRKDQLFHQRRLIAYEFEPLQKHIEMLEWLGVDGMSTDESEGENEDGEPNQRDPERAQYQILNPQWRARRVAVWIRLFDSIHKILRKESGAAAAAGSFPRNRRMTSRQSTSNKFVPGLPINTYDTQWMQSDRMREYDLLPTPKIYDFTHDERIIEFVAFISIHLQLDSLQNISRLAMEHMGRR